MSNIINKTKVFKPNYRDAGRSHIQNLNEYRDLYDKSINNNEKFWSE
ncbi:uncharacterized protein METZ01_LOCUS438485, partial [marine metagenome]